MSQCTIDWAMSRVEKATEHSPLAIFRVPGREDESVVNVVFSSTVITKARVNRGDDLLIGIFHHNMAPLWVREKIHYCLREAANV